MTIVTREKVRAAFERAMAMHDDRETAVQVAAQALGLPVEAVEEVVEVSEEEQRS